MKLDAYPYPFPLQGSLESGTTAVLSIDFQVDFCGSGGYMDRMGIDISLMRAALAPTASVACGGAGARAYGGAYSRERSPRISPMFNLTGSIEGRVGRTSFRAILVRWGAVSSRESRGWEIVPEVAPVAGESVFNKCALWGFRLHRYRDPSEIVRDPSSGSYRTHH